MLFFVTSPPFLQTNIKQVMVTWLYCQDLWKLLRTICIYLCLQDGMYTNDIFEVIAQSKSLHCLSQQNTKWQQTNESPSPLLVGKLDNDLTKLLAWLPILRWLPCNVYVAYPYLFLSAGHRCLISLRHRRCGFRKCRAKVTITILEQTIT